MKKVTFAVLGLGSRGRIYASGQTVFPDKMQVTAIADPRPEALEKANSFLHLPEDCLYQSGEELLKQPKLADVMVIATQDRQHCAHALAALEKGYDLMLEKPISDNPAECRMIAETAEKLGRRVVVCHVLRYTVFYRYIKKLIDDGVLGDVRSINAEEQVGYYHYAHSYVRGNWHKLADSSPMILAKSCHDMDLFLWLTGKNCEKISSFGSLDYFKAENAPENAADRCLDCPLDDCPYNAPKFYFSRIPKWPANVLHPEPTEENLLPILRTSNYGKCVFKMDNDVVDHQTTNILMDDGCTVTFTMTGFSGIQSRTIHVFGTKGDLVGDFKTRTVKVRLFGQDELTVDLTPFYENNVSGHGGGDMGLVQDVISYFSDDDFDSASITLIGRSTQSHYMAFAAEYSRLHGGECVELADFIKQI